MAGISSKAAGETVENKKKYNGIEFDNDLDLNIYEASLRDLDPQTGRWWQIDPKTDEMFMWSTYASNFDNPIRFQDSLGDLPGGCCWEELVTAVSESVDQVLASASGVLWGSLNTITGGAISTDPFNIRPGLSTTSQEFLDKGILYGKVLPLFSPGPKASTKGGPLELVPINGASKNVVAPSATVPIPSIPPQSGPNQNTSNSTQQMKGERGKAGKASGTDNPFKKLKPDPNKDGNVLVKDANGKTVSKKAPDGFKEYWEKKRSN
jgi:RHS repeat-associated protein